MRGYKFNERLEETLELSPSKVAAILRSHRRSFLSAEALHQWSELDPAHPKMREMVSDQLDRGIWRLLWVPPTLPYWPLEGPFHDKAGVTKTLLFSAWNVVPDVVSAILSYEAERRMTGGGGSAPTWTRQGSRFLCCASPSPLRESDPVTVSFSFFCRACRSPTGRIR